MVVMSDNCEAPRPPRWRRAYDGLEHELAPRVEALVGSDMFATVLGLAVRSRRTIRAQIGRVTAGTLHLLNIPAATDVARILKAIGALDKQIRTLQVEIETTKDEASGDDS